MERHKHKLIRNLYIIYSVMFIAASMIIFLPYLLRRAGFVTRADGFNQTYPVFVYTGRYLREQTINILHGKPIQTYDMTIGYGDDILTTLNWFGLSDPFNWISAFIPLRYSTVGYSAALLLRMWFSGIAFIFYCRRMKFQRWSSAVGALFYALSAYTAYYGMIFPPFLLMQCIFPLVLAGIHESADIKHRNKQPFSSILIFSIFLLAINGFYLLYINTILAAVYALAVYSLCTVQNKRAADKWRTFLRKALRILINAGLGVMLSCGILLPVIDAYLKSPRHEESGFVLRDLITVYQPVELVQRIRGFLAFPGYSHGLGIVGMVVLCVLTVFLTRKISGTIHPYARLATVMLIISLALYLLPGTGIVMNGFSYSIDRWYYVIEFYCALLLATQLPVLGRLLCSREKNTRIMIHTAFHPQSNIFRKKSIGLYLGIYGLWTIFSIIVSVLLQTERHSFILQILIISAIQVISAAIIWRHSATERPTGRSGTGTSRLLILITIVQITALGFLNNAPGKIGGSGWSAFFKGWHVDQEIDLSQYVKYAERNDFKRTDIIDTSLAASIVNRTMGTSSYYSIMNPHVYEFMRNYEISSATIGSAFTMQGLDGRLATEMLMSTDYYSTMSAAENIFLNEFSLPIGFGLDSYICQDENAAMTPLTRNAYLPVAVELDKEDAAEAEEAGIQHLAIASLDGRVTEIPCDATYHNLEETNGGALVSGGSGEIVVSGDMSEQESEYYLLLQGMTYGEDDADWLDLDVQGKCLRLRKPGSFYGQADEFLVKVIPEQSGAKGKVSIHIPKGAFFLREIRLLCLDVGNYQECYQKLRQNALMNTKLTHNGNGIAGEFATDHAQILFMSIPYSTGWTCAIDGKEQHILKTDEGFMGVVVRPGIHTIQWIYRTPKLQEGMFISAGALVILAAARVLLYFVRRHSRAAE